MGTLLLLSSLVFSFVVTAALRRYALAEKLLDVPHFRSSHSCPTPRGGGMAFVVSFLSSLLYLTFTGLIGTETFYALFGGGAGVALLGWLDDHGYSITVGLRLLGHFSAALWVLFWLGGMPPVPVFGHTVDLGVFGNLPALLYLAWLLNLYNFMDGIDGLASVEAICVCLGGILLLWTLAASGLGPHYGEGVWLLALLACTVLGFLIWNFPPARIFMGDSGSGFLGIVLGTISLQMAWFSPSLFWCWLILLGVFVVDATFTLLRRLLRGDKIHQSHRSHAYQHAARMLSRHLPVTLGVVAINLFWLLPLALLVVLGIIDGVLGMLIAYAPLIWLVVRLGAGKP
ncbi:MraY family glycosyltransferase [Pseudomonas aeruginosa]|nr:glycosyltransferase family 4 protein [Pseudomonas aeruginosa]EKQ6410355.1 glycosyltransferase family 4 protein [Pseudomonas aeruginosa]EKV0467387.1 glycosyltransferase family 4 protein [Pseudomonas aeruginosa]EKV1421350.1 glycosyltransferase family 4 protein [Pseudomonas aeruginosa]ELC7294710.1 glycosyltransferase family 4 protein [Pseudomonas aeruginosa]